MNWTDNMPYVTIPRQYTYLCCRLPSQTPRNTSKSNMGARILLHTQDHYDHHALPAARDLNYVRADVTKPTITSGIASCRASASSKFQKFDVLSSLMCSILPSLLEPLSSRGTKDHSTISHAPHALAKVNQSQSVFILVWWPMVLHHHACPTHLGSAEWPLKTIWWRTIWWRENWLQLLRWQSWQSPAIEFAPLSVWETTFNLDCRGENGLVVFIPLGGGSVLKC